MLVLSLTAFVISSLIPDQVKREIALVNYSQTGKFSYLIYLKPSVLYGPAPQATPPNPRYPLAAVSTIDFTYSFSPVTKGPESSYVEAVLENPGIWQKRITLVPQTSTTGDFTLSFSLDPGQINSLFEDIEKETGISLPAHSLTIDAHTSSGHDSFVQSLPLTLDKNLVEISGNLSQALPQGKGNFNYVLNRKTSATGPESPLPANYPVEIVSSLDFTFGYQPAVSAAATVSIEAILESPDIWQKSITLVSERPIYADAPAHFTLNLDNLQQQFSDIDKQTKLISSPRVVTLRAKVVQGSDGLVQNLPLTIDKEILQVPGELQLVQPAGTGTFDYVVNLKPNNLFSTGTLVPARPTPTAAAPRVPNYTINFKPIPSPVASPATVLNPGQIAFTRLIDKMDVNFGYQFQSDQPVNALNTAVNIVAVIEAPKAWSKTFPLSQTTQGGNFNISIPFDVASYVTLLQAINSETGVSPDSYDISIIANLHTTGETKSGKIDETFSPSMKGTITGNALQWNKDLIVNQPGSIKTTATVANPDSYGGLSASSARISSVVLAEIFLVLFGISLVLYVRAKAPELSQIEEEALLVKKRYGVRLVEALSIPSGGERAMPLSSMEDLVKVADELAKPIIYQAPGTAGEPPAYFVLDGTILYRYSPAVAVREQGKQPEKAV